jgi:hypothetical protein
MNNCAGKILAELEAVGLVAKTGEFRRDRRGNLTPVYVSTRAFGLITEEEAERRLKKLNEEGPPPTGGTHG